MKNIVLLIALIFCMQGFGQRKPKIKGNRNVVEVNEELPAFNKIELKDDLDVHIKKASREGYSLEADDNLIDVLKFKVEDSTLYISSFYSVTAKKKLNITINYNELIALTLLDGMIRMDDIITGDQLKITTLGDANLQANANVPLIALSMNGNSSGDFNFQTDSVNIALKDKIDARIYTVSEVVSLEMTQNSSAKLEGTTDDLVATLHEKSNLKAEKLQALNVQAYFKDSSEGRVFASKDFELSSSGSSKTYFYGDGKITLMEFLDTSQLNKEK